MPPNCLKTEGAPGAFKILFNFSTDLQNKVMPLLRYKNSLAALRGGWQAPLQHHNSPFSFTFSIGNILPKMK
jgi:hypothetical protein